MITLNEYKKTDNEYQDKNNIDTVNLAKELEKLTNEDIQIKLDLNDNRLSIMISNDTPINFRYLEYQKQYSFGLWQHLRYINYEDIKKIEKNYTKPKNIGVLNAKKVNDWITYYKKIYQDLVKESQEKQDKVNNFLTNFKRVMTSLKTEEYTYLREGKNWNDKPDFTYSGMITKKAIQFHFEINNNGYISQKIDIKTYGLEGDLLDNFVKLSDNKL